MSYLVLHNSKDQIKDANFILSGSKSISQRVLIINYLSDIDVLVENLSNSEDTIVLRNALYSDNNIINVKQSGTALRFLLSLFTFENRNIIVTGEDSLFQRPLKILIKSLELLGGSIVKNNNQIIINDSHLVGASLNFQEMHTSQFISSLLLIAPYLKNGLKLIFPKNTYSLPYIKMTTSIMRDCGANLLWKDHHIEVFNQKYSNYLKDIESDWTSASYLFLAFIFSDLKRIEISKLYKNSLQADIVLVNFFSLFGVNTSFCLDHIILEKNNQLCMPTKIKWDFNHNPDLFPTIMVACLGFNISLLATGIATLPYKESNRVLTIEKECLKFNCTFYSDEKDMITMVPNNSSMSQKKLISIETHNDHRIALAFSTLVLLGWKLKINNPSVINKSYPDFWLDLVKFGVEIENF